MEKNNFVAINTVLAWKIANYTVEAGGDILRMPITGFDSEIEDAKESPLNDDVHPLYIFNLLFPTSKVNYSYSSSHGVLYKYLRPEIITQYPQILQCRTPQDAKFQLGETILILKEHQYKHHDFLG